MPHDVRAAVPVAGQAEVASARVAVGHTGERQELRPMVVALSAHGHAAEDGTVKILHLLPIVGYEVSVDVTDGRCGHIDEGFNCSCTNDSLKSPNIPKSANTLGLSRRTLPSRTTPVAAG